MSDVDPLDEADAVAQLATAASGALADNLAVDQARNEKRGAWREPRPASQADLFLAKQGRMLDLQMEHLHEQRALTLSHLRLRRLNEGFKAVVAGVAVIFGLAVIAFLILLAMEAARSNALVVEPLRTTSDLAQRGLDGTVVASRLLDRLRTIENATDSARAAGSFRQDFGDDIKLEIPQTGVSISDIQRYLRRALGHEVRISGEIVRPWTDAEADGKAGHGLALTVRAGAEPGQTVEGDEKELDGLIEQAAEKVIAETQPYRYTVWLARHGRLVEANTALAKLAASGGVQDRAWAYAYWGGISAQLDGDLIRAETKEESAIALDPKLAVAHDNLAGFDVMLGREDMAVRHLRGELESLESSGASQLSPGVRPFLLAWARTRLAESRGDFAGAIKEAEAIRRLPDYEDTARGALLNEAAAYALAHDPGGARRILAALDPPLAGSSFLDSFESGSALLPEVALDEAAGDWAADRRDLAAAQQAAVSRRWGASALRGWIWPKLALAMARSGDVAGAWTLVGQTPLDCVLCLRMRAQVAAAHGDWRAALAWADRAVAADPASPFARVERGRILLAQGKAREALAAFEQAHARSPAFADALEGAGEASMAVHDPVGAAERFAAAMRLAPAWEAARREWAHARAAAGKH